MSSQVSLLFSLFLRHMFGSCVTEDDPACMAERSPFFEVVLSDAQGTQGTCLAKSFKSMFQILVVNSLASELLENCLQRQMLKIYRNKGLFNKGVLWYGFVIPVLRKWRIGRGQRQLHPEFKVTCGFRQTVCI